jgi:2-C-methyl-D-erythritol 2,4-cyclodiphosphate synthase
MDELRIGNGYDIHRLVRNKPLTIGNVIIPFNRGFLAHSDGDVLIHALIDSLFGAANLGDIGTHFPDNDPEYKDADSAPLLEKAVRLIREKKFEIINIDAIIICEKPKLKCHIPGIKKRLSEILHIEIERISVKAKTREKLGDIGKGKAIEAYSVCLLGRNI